MFHLNAIDAGRLSAVLLCALFSGVTPAAEPGASDSAWFGELPVVLSVTRLAQPLADTPGAVTIIDREMIRKSGVRDVVELLRFVPGFITGRMGNGAHPSASYHASLDTLYGGRHMQVFVDGRSVYSTLFIGDTHQGLMGAVLEDVERIEVLRGSNSAAYGANAFLGVINIITRNAADTHGAMASVTSGNQGVNDVMVRLGAGNAQSSVRVTASQRRDDGSESFRPGPFNQAYDDRQVRQFHIRGDLRPDNSNEILLQAGSTKTVSGAGTGDVDVDSFDPFRDETSESSYAQLRWLHDISAKESLMFTVQLDWGSHDDPVANPFTSFGPTIGGVMGSSRRQNVEIQHTKQYTDTVRAVLGASFRHEMVEGKYLFRTDGERTQNQKRLFGNLEWYATPDWVLNAGGLYEYNSNAHSDFSPRVMLNYHLTPEQTVRIGATRATRTPTIVERQGYMQMFSSVTGQPITWFIQGNGQLEEETVHSKEIGYLGNFQRWNLSVDLRLFHENIRNVVDLPQVVPGIRQYVFQNSHDLKTEGLEQQWRWTPRPGTQFIFNHTYTHVRSDDPNNKLKAPRISHSGMWFQQLPGGFDLSLMYSHVGEMRFGDPGDPTLPAYDQVDVRLAYPFRIGKTRAEAAIVSQAINDDHLEDIQNIQFSRRTFATLRLEF